MWNNEYTVFFSYKNLLKIDITANEYSMDLTKEDIDDLRDHMMGQTLPELVDQCIFNMYKHGSFSKEQKIGCIRHNYPNESDEFISKKYDDIFAKS